MNIMTAPSRGSVSLCAVHRPHPRIIIILSRCYGSRSRKRKTRCRKTEGRCFWCCSAAFSGPCTAVLLILVLMRFVSGAPPRNARAGFTGRGARRSRGRANHTWPVLCSRLFPALPPFQTFGLSHWQPNAAHRALAPIARTEHVVSPFGNTSMTHESFPLDGQRTGGSWATS
ncbi:hypothetical protein L210DRAFT_580404 [Boletus edulis BED1]|uniref:Uncharacterized protein n=1 Tax=Boletus edulis BED1 TaxID=1328754 RepID=A0AAD4BQ69_BOLED|nr:hypothetical protein L210DRAFT_580404 [Boletus edulis BED1]